MEYNREILIDSLVHHQRRDIEGCICGWAVLGASHAEHVANVYETSLAFSRQPDVWYGAKQGQMRFWCINGEWYWRNVGDDGTVLAEGLGRP